MGGTFLLIIGRGPPLVLYTVRCFQLPYKRMATTPQNLLILRFVGFFGLNIPFCKVHSVSIAISSSNIISAQADIFNFVATVLHEERSARKSLCEQGAPHRFNKIEKNYFH